MQVLEGHTGELYVPCIAVGVDELSWVDVVVAVAVSLSSKITSYPNSSLPRHTPSKI